jgi:hypothetical protein
VSDLPRMNTDRVFTPIVDEDGLVVLRVGMLVTLYFPYGHSLEKRQAVLDCFEDYYSACREHLRWWVIEDENFRQVSQTASNHIRNYLVATPWDRLNSYWAFFWHGGDTEDEASEFRIFGLGQPRTDSESSNDLSFLSVTLPPSWASERREEAIALVLRFARRMQPVHGYAGLGFIDAADDGLAAANEKKLYALAMRYSGLEVDYPLDHSLETKEGIKGGSWITVLSEPYLHRLGGSHALLRALGPPFEAIEYPGGALIVAGLAPEIGDRNRRMDTPKYRRLARALKPIRITSHSGVGESFDSKFDQEAFEAWLRRFD